MPTSFQNVHVIINPASGGDEPILNPINDVFGQHGIKWEARVTHEAGDATRLTAEAIDAGADLIACYGGDGTLNEVVNGMVGRDVPLGLLPGGTGNGVATEVGIPADLRAALEVLAADGARRKLDVGRCNDRHFMLRAFVGLPEDFNPSRELKDRIGFLAYPIYAVRFLTGREPVRYRITIDDLAFEEDGLLCLVNNVGYANGQRLQELAERVLFDVRDHATREEAATDEATGQSVLAGIRPDDGLLDVLLVTGENSLLQSLTSLVVRNKDNAGMKVHCFQGRRVAISAATEQEMRLDGEDGGRTPAQIEILPGAIELVVPAMP